MTIGFQGVPLDMQDEKAHRRKMAVAINSLLQGKMNAVLPVTLNKSATGTTVIDPRIGFSSSLLLQALTADAVTAFNNGITPSNQINGQVTLSHGSYSVTDLNFNLVIIG